jgi:predicted nucleotidyltransferase
MFGNSEIFLDPGRVPDHMQVKIKDALRFLEYQNGYKILFAYESGSRAWNFHSPDSDYDVRFVYVRVKENYLSVSPARDVCESFKSQAKGTAYEDDLLDIVGWDLSKALHLMRKSNPQLIEWLNGPLPYYIADPAFNQHLLSISRRITRMEPIYMHYRGMATGNFREYLQGDEVRYKKYLYVIRPLLAAQYVYENMSIPPVDFKQLQAVTDDSQTEEFRASLNRLLAYKTQVQESATMPKDPVLNTWIEERLAHKVDFKEGPGPTSEQVTAMLDSAFTQALEKWGN